MSIVIEALELALKLNHDEGGWSHHRELFMNALEEERKKEEPPPLSLSESAKEQFRELYCDKCEAAIQKNKLFAFMEDSLRAIAESGGLVSSFKQSHERCIRIAQVAISRVDREKYKKELPEAAKKLIQAIHEYTDAGLDYSADAAKLASLINT